MILELHRDILTPEYTLGKLYIGGVFEAFVCEDTVRHGPKVPGKTAIPAGRYEVAVSFSNRFQKLLPLLLHVPNFEGIRIHPGNSNADTEGCLLPGQTRDVGQGRVGSSRFAFELLFNKIQAALKTEKVFIDIKETA